MTLPSLAFGIQQRNEKGAHGGLFACSESRQPWGWTSLPSLTLLALCPQEQSTVRKDVILKMLAGLLGSVDAGGEVAFPAEQDKAKLEEDQAVLGRLAQLSQRDRKAPCKNFFWKTFTSC